MGKTTAKASRKASPKATREYSFPVGSMGPKVEAACRFTEATGNVAAIGALRFASDLVGKAGTTIEASVSSGGGLT